MALDSGKATNLDENVLRLYVAVKDAVSVHVIDGLAQLVHKELHFLL